MKIKRTFTWEEANALVPRLTEIFGVVAQLRSQLRSTYERLAELGAPPGQSIEPERAGSPEVLRLQAHFQGFYEALGEQLRQVEELGALVKDIDTGLVDFFYERDGREVLLCWRYGENEIGWGHEIETGFPGRHPIEESDRRRRRRPLLH